MKAKKKRNFLLIITILILIIGIILLCVFIKKIKINKKDITNTSNLENNNEYKIVSKYNANIKDYQDVKVRILEIKRGEEAKKDLQEYNEKHESYPIDIKVKEDEELAIIEYEINFMNFDMGTIGTIKDMQVLICQNEENGFINYNNKIYVPAVKSMNGIEFTSDNETTCKCITTLPIGCIDYKIKIGISDKNVAYFQGK